jgi:hypothetical protein
MSIKITAYSIGPDDAASRTAWQTQADQIAKIRQHRNDLGKVVQKLNKARDTASLWQQEAIDRLDRCRRTWFRILSQ